MEFPRAALNVQRGLALAMLTAVLGAAAAERASPFAARLRAAEPWPFWLEVREPGSAAAPGFHLGVYHPLRRVLVLIRVPGTARLRGKVTADGAYRDALRASGDAPSASRAVEDLAQIRFTELSLEPIRWDGAGRLRLELETFEEPDEPAAAAAAALKARGRSPRALWRLVRAAAAGFLAGDRSAGDALLLTLELRRVPFDRLQPALLPDDAASSAFLARAFAPQVEPRGGDKAIVAEVLNGTTSPGLAAQAAKVLRLNGVDVMALGKAQPRSQTTVYDRIGEFESAARVRAALGCPTAIAATRIDALRGVDVSVELGDDCSD
ncbi:MAG: LytR C-terminal domain-containing protein [Elusimicrobiota bacterium]|nr:LytR C-terminal domain-containing protein [Elusimicrobiota bacterium]